MSLQQSEMRQRERELEPAVIDRRPSARLQRALDEEEDDDDDVRDEPDRLIAPPQKKKKSVSRNVVPIDAPPQPSTSRREKTDQVQDKRVK